MKNNNNLEKFITEMESIKMTSSEKNQMCDSLESFAMNYVAIVSPYHRFSIMMRRGLAVVFVAIISIGSFTNFVSSDALPGDDLYFVKIAHEEIKVAATFDNKKKISYEIKRTKKRIQEATTLANKDGLNTETQTNIAQSIQEQTTKVAKNIEKVKKEEPEQALILNSELKSTLTVNSQALRQATTARNKEIVIVENPENIDETSSAESLLEEINREIKIIEINSEKISEKIIAEEIVTEEQPLKTEINDKDIEETSIEKEEIQENITVEHNTDDEQEIIDVEIAVIDSANLISKEDNEQEEDILEINSSGKNLDEPLVMDSLEKISENTNTKKTSVENISHSINSLEDILVIENRINELKEKTYVQNIDTLVSENIFDEEVLRAQADILITERKYKQAFLVLEEILSYYQEQLIVQETELELGIHIDKVSKTKTNSTLDTDPSEEKPITR